ERLRLKSPSASECFRCASASGAHEGDQQQNFSDLLAQPAGSRPLPRLEMRPEDLGRPRARAAQPLPLPGVRAFALTVCVARAPSLATAAILRHHASNLA